ncbi:hypothetical protein [Luteipulveratus halotolerans]|uniref:Uncharacterized protein n=1 Tax=Luteipulveratus halotolerans TaxID=1631356 RepID=A0A0L6CIP3_9MICO|nr:hypothetical protein [Luteipulveratus halotolerans]KNX37672.1 hypothetical protein VV01_11820 [Luteipulveratus halotolerans]
MDERTRVRPADPWRSAAVSLAHVCALLGALALIAVMATLVFLLAYDASTGGDARRNPVWIAGAALILLAQVAVLVTGRRGAVLTARERPAGPVLVVVAGALVAVQGAWLSVHGAGALGALAALCGITTVVAGAVVTQARRTSRP